MKNASRDVIVIRVLAKFATAIITIFAFYIQFHGKVSPGGGFQAGIVLSIAFIFNNLIDLCANIKRKDFLTDRAMIITSIIGIICYILSGVIFEERIFDYTTTFTETLELRQIKRKIGILIIETGIGLSVLGAMSLIYRSIRDCALKVSMNAKAKNISCDN